MRDFNVEEAKVILSGITIHEGNQELFDIASKALDEIERLDEILDSKIEWIKYYEKLISELVAPLKWVDGLPDGQGLYYLQFFMDGKWLFPAGTKTIFFGKNTAQMLRSQAEGPFRHAVPLKPKPEEEK